MVLVYAAALSAAPGGPIVPTNVPPVKLFDELDYGLPGLRKVKAAVDAGDMNAAKAELLRYFRGRKDARKPNPKKKYNTHLADNILLGKFIWGKTVCWYGPKISDIDWYRVPKGIYWPTWDHELGRHTFVTTLVRAYSNTGNEKYARHLIALMTDFIKRCPVEDGRHLPDRIDNADGYAARRFGVEHLHTKGHPAMMWDQMVAMRRIQRWPDVIRYCVHSKHMTGDALVAILKTIIEHQRYLVDALPFSGLGNHGTRTPTTVLQIASRFPEIKESAKWADAAVASLLERYNHYTPKTPKGFIYPDGAGVEICPNVVWGDYGTLLQAMRWMNAMSRDVPDQLVKIRGEMISYLAYMTWPEAFARYAKRPRNVPKIPGRADLDYIQSGGTRGARPEHASYPMRSGDAYYAGTYWMRSAWDAKGVWLRVRFGPIQYKYSQFGLGDFGDVGVWGYGMHLIPHLHVHPRIGPFAKYGDRSFRGHGRSENTISVDNIGQSKANRDRRIFKPLGNTWATTPQFDYVRGSYKFDQRRVKLTHTRAVLFVKPDYFVVMDRLDGDTKTHAYRMKYQLSRELVAQVDGVRAVGERQGAPRIVVLPSRSDLDLSVVRGREESPREGWHGYAAEKFAPAPALIYTWNERAPTRVETVLWPVKPGHAADIEVTRSAKDGVVTLTVKRGEHEDVVTCGKDDNVTLCRKRLGRVVVPMTRVR